MRILIVEDAFEKREDIVSFLNKTIGEDASIDEAESLRSGLKKIVSCDEYDLILLDMSMPSFDVGVGEPAGGDPESFAGKELMAHMKLRNIRVPVIVITQYRTFEQGSVTLEELGNEFARDFGEFFLGSIYYNSTVDSWKSELSEHLKTVQVKKA